uniref:Uncharacterized protein n=1 Tax=Avena sativa TaxID=4498 RepID=A0ACD5YS85_AVESA
MTHQTLISSAPAFSSAPHLLHASLSSSSSSSSSPTRSSSSAPASVMSSSSSFAHHHGSLVEREAGSMSALRSSLWPYEAAEEVAAAVVAGPAAWGAGLLGDGFLVEDLLDLEELCEVEKDGGGLLCEAAPAAEEEEEEKCSDSHGSSVVSYELMPLLPPEMDLPAHDAEELEWVSRIMDDSLAELPPPPPRLPAAPWRQHGAAYPMRTPTICMLSTEALVPVRSKKRSKRSRATTVWSLSGSSISDSASSSTTTTSSASSSASFFLLDSPAFFAASNLDEPARSKKSSKHGSKKRGRKPKHNNHFPPHLPASGPSPPVVQGDRRCSHCGVQKTPQWRAGPEGAKTLCNACGVRFKSGRLLPEYRPACSPTFVGDLHSNSHRKVLEMRRKKDPVVVAAPTVASF